ncbi:OmpW/AlkL family protein [Rhodovulum sp. DZ06]|uniref:OmpW/AlkL family protein n=1 Tax=Rhodovulum sp. DZ06 TaxID=3425126 RepID=UPI003D3361B7
MFRRILAAAAMAAALPALPAAAEDGFFTLSSDGDLMVRLRGVFVAPNDDVRVDQVGGADGDISTSVIPELDFTYFFTPNIAAELILGTTPHDIDGKGAINGLDVGSVWLLPPTLTLQYHVTQLGDWTGIKNMDKIKPYFGAGVNYTIFYGESAGDPAVGTVSLDDTFGVAFQAGVDIEITEGIYANMDVKYIMLETDWTSSTGLSGKAEINPVLVGFGIGARF